MVWAFSDRLTGRTPDTASAVEIAIGQQYRGSGLSHRMLAALRDAVRDAGLTNPAGGPRAAKRQAPVSGPADDRIHHDGASRRLARRPVAASIRTSRRVDQAGGGGIYGHGWLARAVAGMDRTAIRPYRRRDRARGAGPRALHAEHDHAVYVEPNIWVEHTLSDAGPGPNRP